MDHKVGLKGLKETPAPKASLELHAQTRHKVKWQEDLRHMMEEEVGVTVEHTAGMAEDEHELVLVLVSVLVAADMADIVAAVG